MEIWNIDYALHNFHFKGNYIMWNARDLLFEYVRDVCVLVNAGSYQNGQHTKTKCSAKIIS